MKLKIVNQFLLDQVISEAKVSPRLRMNYNFHTDLGDNVEFRNQIK